MTDSSDFKETVKQQADIVRIVGDYVKLKKTGAQNYSGLCPFHNEKTPSFSVHATRQFFHCFGCGVSGDVFSFVQKIENITFPEAVRALAQKLGLALPKTSYSSPAEAKETRLRTLLLDVHEQACVFFQGYLRRPEGAHAREYLAGRGLNEEIIRTFRIGYAPDSGFLLRDRLRGEFEEEVLQESGLFSWKAENSRQLSDISPQQNTRSFNLPIRSQSGATKDIEPTTNDRRPTTASMYSKFRNRVMFPLRNEGGRIIAFTGRTLSVDEKAGPKYLNSPETAIYSKSRLLFNLDQAKEAIRKLDYAILVEGQMDCISVFAAGFHNVIASSGTAFTDLQARLLGRFTKNVVVNFDPDLFIARKGKDAYATALKNSQKYFDYLIERARSQFPVRSGEGKVKAVNYLLPHIQRVPSRIVRDELAREMAQKLGIDSSILRQELKHAAASRSSASVKAPVDVQVTDAERIMIRALASPITTQTSQEHFSARDGTGEAFDPAGRAQFVLKSERLHLGLATESLMEVLISSRPEVMTDLPLPESDRNLVASILMNEDEELIPERLEGAVRALRRIQLRRKLEGVQRELQVGREKDPARVQALLQEKMRLKRALMDPNLAEESTAARSA